MNLFGCGLSVFLEICKYFFQFILICAVVLSVLTIIEHTILAKIVNNKDIKTDNMSILENKENKNDKESKE